MSYTPGYDTAKFLNRRVYCPCCAGQGFTEALHSSNGFDVDSIRRYNCENCERGTINWLDYKNFFQGVFGRPRFV